MLGVGKVRIADVPPLHRITIHYLIGKHIAEQFRLFEATFPAAISLRWAELPKHPPLIRLPLLAIGRAQLTRGFAR
jgi:hypothetical protein